MSLLSDQPFRTFFNFDPTDPSRFHKGPIDEEYFDWLFSLLEGTGLTFLYRCNTAGRTYYHSKVMAAFDHECVDPYNEEAQYWHRTAEMMDIGDPFAAAVKAARKHDVPIWAWCNWNEFQNTRQDYLSLIDPVWYESPRKYWCSRDGSRFYHGIPAFGDPAVQERLVAMTREILGYGVDGFYLSTRSHSWWACFDSPGWDDHLELFGFNDCVVDEYRKRHGIDIRFKDYDYDEFLRIKGDHFSEMLAKVGRTLHDADTPFVIGVSPDRHELCVEFESIGIPAAKHLHMYKDWERWAEDGTVDGLCTERSCPHEKVLDPPGLDIFQDSLPDGFPLFLWLDMGRWINRGFGPFHLANWDRYPVDESMGMLEQAKKTVAGGAFLHTLYHYTACDSGGESIGGYGVLPRTEYFDALRNLE